MFDLKEFVSSLILDAENLLEFVYSRPIRVLIANSLELNSGDPFILEL